MAGFAGLQGAAGASRLGVGSKKRPSRQWAVNEGAQRPVIFRPFLGPGAHGKPPYHRPQVDLDALPNRGRGCSMGCRRDIRLPVAMTEKFCSGTSQIRSAHWINPPWGVFPRLGWSVAPFVRPQQRPRAEPGERRAELLRRALPCLARPPLDPPSQALALARRPRYALPQQGASSAAKRLSYKNAAEMVILHIESCVYIFIYF